MTYLSSSTGQRVTAGNRTWLMLICATEVTMGDLFQVSKFVLITHPVTQIMEQKTENRITRTHLFLAQVWSLSSFKVSCVNHVFK